MAHMIDIREITVRYNLALQKRRSTKEYLISILKHDLHFQEFIALKSVSLSVNQGESWGIIGKNGSGKSTLLKVIAGILKPYRGEINVNGTIAPLLELGAGFDAELTGRENIFMNGLILGMSEADIRKRFDEIVDFAEIEQFLDVPLKNYSSGMKSRLGFSIATSSRSDILIADEVLSTGDQFFQKKCEARMNQLRQEGTTLLFVSHSTQAIKRTCEHILWLDQGSVVMQGMTNEVLPAYEKQKA